MVNPKMNRYVRIRHVDGREEIVTEFESDRLCQNGIGHAVLGPAERPQPDISEDDTQPIEQPKRRSRTIRGDK